MTTGVTDTMIAGTDRQISVTGRVIAAMCVHRTAKPEQTESLKTMFSPIETEMLIARPTRAGSSVTETAGHGLTPVHEHQAVVRVFNRTGPV
jgi:hypothetical protein